MLRRYHAEALRLHMGQILSTVQQDSSESEGDSEATMVRQRQWTGHRQSKFARSRCGRRHQPRKCLAWGKTCSKCRGLNRFAAMCRAKKAFHSSLRPRVPSWYGFLPLSIVLGLTYHCHNRRQFRHYCCNKLLSSGCSSSRSSWQQIERLACSWITYRSVGRSRYSAMSEPAFGSKTRCFKGITPDGLTRYYRRYRFFSLGLEVSRCTQEVWKSSPMCGSTSCQQSSHTWKVPITHSI